MNLNEASLLSSVLSSTESILILGLPGLVLGLIALVFIRRDREETTKKLRETDDKLGAMIDVQRKAADTIIAMTIEKQFLELKRWIRQVLKVILISVVALSGLALLAFVLSLVLSR